MEQSAEPLFVLDSRVPLPALAGASVRLAVTEVSPWMQEAPQLAAVLLQLSPQRRAKAAAYTNPRSRALSVGATLALDHLLREVGLRERDMTYVTGPHGKPAFSALPRHLFNLSHSGTLAAAAMLTGCPQDVAIGLDIQRVTRYRPELVRRQFTDADRARLAAVAGEEQRQSLFTQLWSRAEAYAKATGKGIESPFPEPSPNATFFEFTIGTAYCGSLCVLT